MPTPTQTPDQDEFNPVKNIGDIHEAQRMAHYNTNHSRGAGNPTDPRSNDVAANNASDPRSELLEKEQSAAEDTPSDEDLGTQETRGNRSDTPWIYNNHEEQSRRRFQLSRRQGIGLGIFGTGAVFLALLPGFLSPLILINFKEVIDVKFNSRPASVLSRLGDRIFLKMLTTDPNDPTKGCSGTAKVRCRYAGVTEEQKKKFEERTGMKLETEGEAKDGKFKVRAVSYPEGTKTKTISAREFAKAYKDNPRFKESFYKFNKPKVAMWRDVASSRFFTKLKVYRGPLKNGDEGDGKTDEQKRRNRIESIVTNRVSGAAYDTSIRVGTGAASDEDAAGKATEAKNAQLAGGISEEVDALAKEAENTPSGKRVNLNVRGGAIGSAIQSVCLVRSLMNAAAIGVKVTAATQLIRYAMLYMTAADQIKSGDADGRSSQSVGDLASTLVGTNSQTGRSASDSFGYQYASTGTIVNDSSGKPDIDQIKRFMLGWGIGGTLSGIANFGPYRTTCKIISAILNVLPSPPLLDKLTEPLNKLMIGAATSLALAYAGKVIDGNETSEETGNAIVSGGSAAASLNGRMHGMYPLQKESLTANTTQSIKTMAERDKVDNINQFDIYQPGSFAYKLASAGTANISSLSVASLPNILAGFTNSSIASLLQSPKILAASEKEASEVCTDDTYNEKNVATDPFCNPLPGYDLSKLGDNEESAYEPSKVLDYMLTGNYISPDGEPMEGEYRDFIDTCIETDAPIDSVGDEPTPEECYLPPEKTSDPIKYNMFRQYYLATTIDDQFNDREGDTSAGGGGAVSDTTISGDIGELPSGSAKDLAKQIIDSGKVSGQDNYMQQIKNLAEGNSSCPVSEKILGLILALSKKYKLFISSLNRKCSNNQAGAGTASLHYANGGGRAVDFSMVDGMAMTYTGAAKDKARDVFNDAAKILPKNAELGQINSCNVGGVNTNGIKDIVPDACNHIHIGIPD